MHQASVGFHCPECVAAEHTRTVNPIRAGFARPVLTIALIVINAAVWVGGQVVWRSSDALDTSAAVITKWALFASIPTQVSQVGGRPVYSGYLGVAEGQWYRLLSAGFIHAGLIHIAMNMWVLYVLGRIIETQLGRSRMGLIYFASLFAGSLGALLLAPNVPTVGASGAIFGLMGAILAIAKARGIALRNTGLVGLVVLNLVITFSLSRYISVGAHVGGLIGGAVAGLVVVDLPDRMRNADRRTRMMVSWAGGIGLCLVFIASAIVVANAAGNGFAGG